MSEKSGHGTAPPADAISPIDGIIPISTLCEAVGVSESLVQHLYDDFVNNEPGKISLKEAVLGVGEPGEGAVGQERPWREQEDPLPLVAVAEGELNAVYATAAAAEEEQIVVGEAQPLLRETTSEFALESAHTHHHHRRRRHVRDVSDDFAAAALQAIHAPEDVEMSRGEGINIPSLPFRQRPPLSPATESVALASGRGQRHCAPKLPPPISQRPPMAPPTATSPANMTKYHRRTVSEKVLLEKLMHRADSFKSSPPNKIPRPSSAKRSLTTGSFTTEALRSIFGGEFDEDMVPGPARTLAKVNSWDRSTILTNRAAFIILDASSEQQQRARGTRPTLSPNNYARHRRGNSLLPDLLPNAIADPIERSISALVDGKLTLPSDVDEISITIDRHEGLKGETESVDVLLVVKRSIPAVGYLLLGIATLSMSTAGAILAEQKGVSPSIKAYWRMTATWMTLFVFALRSVVRESGGLPILSMYEWSLFLWCGLGYAMCAEFFVIAISLTSVMNVYIFANCHCLLFVLLKLLTGAPIACKEGSGAVIGFVGGIICALGGVIVTALASRGHRGRYLDSEISASYVGDCVAIFSAVGSVIYLSVAKRLRRRCDLFFYMFIQFFVASVWLLIFMLIRGERFTLSADPHFGLWGWVHPRKDRLLIELWLVVVCNFGGLVGYIAAMKYFDPLVISCCQNLNPVIASYIAVMLGVNPQPGLLTLIGDAIVFCGTYMVITSRSKKMEVTDVKEVARDKEFVDKKIENES